MSPRTWFERIQDILDAIAEIQTFTAGMDYETFKDDTRTIHPHHPGGRVEFHHNW